MGFKRSVSDVKANAFLGGHHRALWITFATEENTKLQIKLNLKKKIQRFSHPTLQTPLNSIEGHICGSQDSAMKVSFSGLSGKSTTMGDKRARSSSWLHFLSPKPENMCCLTWRPLGPGHCLYPQCSCSPSCPGQS